MNIQETDARQITGFCDTIVKNLLNRMPSIALGQHHIANLDVFQFLVSIFGEDKAIRSNTRCTKCPALCIWNIRTIYIADISRCWRFSIDCFINLSLVFIPLTGINCFPTSFIKSGTEITHTTEELNHSGFFLHIKHLFLRT